MKTKGWLAVALVAGGVVVVNRGCLNQVAPDEKLATYLDEMCAIARANLETPEAGVRSLGRYVNKNASSILGDFGATIALIERIEDDRKHDERAVVARDRMQKPLRACERDWAKFGQAVERDPKARALRDRGMRRLNRTLEIIFGGKQVDFIHLPAQLDQRLGG